MVQYSSQPTNFEGGLKNPS